jgi:hypothetical protein
VNWQRYGKKRKVDTKQHGSYEKFMKEGRKKGRKEGSNLKIGDKKSLLPTFNTQA